MHGQLINGLTWEDRGPRLGWRNPYSPLACIPHDHQCTFGGQWAIPRAHPLAPRRSNGDGIKKNRFK